MKRKKDCTSCQHCHKLKGTQYKSFGSADNKIWWICDLHDYRIDYPDRYKCDNWKERHYNKETFIYAGEQR